MPKDITEVIQEMGEQSDSTSRQKDYKCVIMGTTEGVRNLSGSTNDFARNFITKS